MRQEDREEVEKMAYLAARMISEEPHSVTATSCERTAKSEAEALMARVKDFKIETMCQGFSCECGAGGAVQTKPEHLAR
jgi:hypothetical protein